jgi:serine/threonine-protein kinase
MVVMGASMVGDVGRLWADGIPISVLFGGRVPDALSAGHPDGPTMALAAPSNDEALSGPFGGVLRQAISDDKTIKELLGKLSDTERKMLPDVKATEESLFARIQSLAAALQRMEQQVAGQRLPDLDAKITEAEEQGGIAESTERARRLSLLRRQRVTLAELTASRAGLLEQYESAGLLLQNLALDMLKVRSSGLDSAINGINSATQEARALSREIGYVLSAADELNVKS